jgi:anti-anti-sigma factor
MESSLPSCWVRVHHDVDVTRLEAGGELSFESRDALRDAVDDVFGRVAQPDLLIDLRDVTFIDSTGLQLAVLLPAARAHDIGRSVRVVASPVVRDKLTSAGLTHLMADGQS